MSNVRDIKHEPKASTEQVASAKAWLVKNKKRFGATANFAVFGESGKPCENIVQACHYNIQHSQPNNKNLRTCVATECGWNRITKGMSKDWARPFMNWLLNESYFSPYFLNRDDPEFCLEHGFVVSADVWAPLLQNIMIITRSFTEQASARFRKFGELTTQGVPGDLAFALCFTTNLENTTKETYPVGWAGSGHRTTQTFNLAALLNFLEGETCHPLTVLNDPNTHYRVNRAYLGGSAIFWPDQNVASGGKTFITDLFEDKTSGFRESISAYRKSTTQGEMYRAPNPFQKRDPYAATVNANEISYKELWEVFVPWFMDRYYDDNGFNRGKVLNNG